MIDRRVALVTGAGRGIGRGIAEALAGHGWFVVINYRGNTTTALDTLDGITRSGGAAIAEQADISTGQDRTRLVERIMDHLGRIDLLVNNVGMAPRQRCDLLEMAESSYDEVMAVNLKGPFFLTQLVAHRMIELISSQRIETARIINIGSISAYTSSPTRGEYCISKAGMAMMTLLLADRLAPYGINVYEVRPGIIETDMTSGVAEKYTKMIADGLTPIQRWGKPADVGAAVAALAEGALPFSTGEVINVDGGFHFRRL